MKKSTPKHLQGFERKLYREIRDIITEHYKSIYGEQCDKPPRAVVQSVLDEVFVTLPKGASHQQFTDAVIRIAQREMPGLN
jgi:hypothetical protein